MSEEQTEDIKTIRVLTFLSEQQDWDEWSQKFLSMAVERGYREIMEDKESPPPLESVNIEEKKTDGTYKLSESERSELKRKRKADTEICSLLANIWPANWSVSPRQHPCQVDV